MTEVEKLDAGLEAVYQKKTLDCGGYGPRQGGK